MDTSTWPKGLPYPTSWLRAIVLTATYGCTSSFLAKLTPMSGIAFWLLASWTASAACMTVYHHCLTGGLFKTAWNKPSRDSLREGINALIVSLIAFIITLVCLIYLFYAAAPEEIEESQIDKAVTYQVLNTVTVLISAAFAGGKLDQPITEVLSQDFEPLVNVWFTVFCIWFVSVLLLYQLLYQLLSWYDLWIQSRRAEKIAKDKKAANRKPTASKKTSSKSKKPKKSQPPADPVEIDLNRLKGELGTTVVKSVRKTPDPQQTQWYVFRSGNAEGPYTREQLWLAQRITARTNVRREGETDWTRAGEIPELADFLNSK